MKNALMLAKSPRIGTRHPPSPKQPKPAPVAVALSAEDSSVASFAIPNRKPNPLKLCTYLDFTTLINVQCWECIDRFVFAATSKVSDTSSCSPTNSVGSYTPHDNDSGHNSITSSTLDALSTGSNSPPRNHLQNQHPLGKKGEGPTKSRKMGDNSRVKESKA